MFIAMSPGRVWDLMVHSWCFGLVLVVVLSHNHNYVEMACQYGSPIYGNVLLSLSLNVPLTFAAIKTPR